MYIPILPENLTLREWFAERGQRLAPNAGVLSDLGNASIAEALGRAISAQAEQIASGDFYEAWDEETTRAAAVAELTRAVTARRALAGVDLVATAHHLPGIPGEIRSLISEAAEHYRDC